jgi:heme oxygenase (mycobilin-producing)
LGGTEWVEAAASGMLERMSVVKINAIQIPEGMGPQLEERFAGRAKMVEQFEGFEDFQLLRPVEGEDRYFVYTRWATEEAFQAWLKSQEFGQGHGGGPASGGHPGGPPQGAQGPQGAAPDAPAGDAPKPVAQGASLLSFEVVEHVVKGS